MGLKQYPMRKITPAIHSSYLEEVLNYRNCKKIHTKIKNLIKKKNLKFDSIAFSGQSGALVAMPLCLELNKWPLLVRKNKEICHSDARLEGNLNSEKCLIIDDFIDTGSTMKRIIKVLKNFQIEPVAIIEYNGSYYSDYEDEFYNYKIFRVK